MIDMGEINHCGTCPPAGSMGLLEAEVGTMRTLPQSADGQDLDSLTMQTMRNVLAADKDRKHLHDMYRFCPKENVTWVHTKAEGISLTEHYETVKMAVFDVDNVLMKANGIAGLSGIVAGTRACNVFRYLNNTYLEVAPGYRFSAQPHYVGRLFGYIDLFCDPYAPDPWSCLCYAKGEGVEEDAEQAAYWIHKAAEQGHVGAQVSLGVCYHDGDSVERDEKQAAHWFRKAAEQGIAHAQFSLGVCYYYGIGVEKDLVQAAYL